ncbi:dihydrofolate synthase / folylpolyglutamate synthase [Desulfuromusa kysingii]|uniref:Dihydrofolate synthase/folylpolyglutamate synthase n=1 Tax=Desulfuromusa kysingii TaxID=37625 RepID=A0A1H3X0R3_9BACT|nr:folylpolyglutamate synthase/dihydrofolate synthase family protein [Desulfuromusa kysingii]SDZ92108.1 dihydrofolate synthase / folylpolyglutamate synthase [Desulfuromusa kysingii]
MANYQESLAYLYSLQFFGIKLGLENIHKLLSCVGNPQQSLRIIHIAGTNGKGSTAAALASIFNAAGISAGLYTSPHLHSFTERIRIDTRQISESDAVALIEELRPHAEALKVTFFEFTTAMAFLYFQRRGVEWAILETGMGGRLDATNVVHPELCLITPIALDHSAYLGTELVQVAAEKAGICKSGVAVISGYQEVEVQSVLRQRAAELDIPLLEFGVDYHWHGKGDAFRVTGGQLPADAVKVTQAGEHQQQNFALAAAAIDYLAQAGLEISAAEIQAGLDTACWPGRLEWLADRILLDGAHNPAGARKLATYLQQQGLGNLHLIVGCKAGKQANELVSALLPFVRCVYATQPPVDAVVPIADIVQRVQATGTWARGFVDPIAALQAALEGRSSDDIILVAGSLFLVAEIRAFLLSEVDSLVITR